MFFSNFEILKTKRDQLRKLFIIFITILKFWKFEFEILKNRSVTDRFLFSKFQNYKQKLWNNYHGFRKINELSEYGKKFINIVRNSSLKKLI